MTSKALRITKWINEGPTYLGTTYKRRFRPSSRRYDDAYALTAQVWPVEEKENPQYVIHFSVMHDDLLHGDAPHAPFRKILKDAEKQKFSNPDEAKRYATRTALDFYVALSVYYSELVSAVSEDDDLLVSSKPAKRAPNC